MLILVNFNRRIALTVTMNGVAHPLIDPDEVRCWRTEWDDFCSLSRHDLTAIICSATTLNPVQTCTVQNIRFEDVAIKARKVHSQLWILCSPMLFGRS